MAVAMTVVGVLGVWLITLLSYSMLPLGQWLFILYVASSFTAIVLWAWFASRNDDYCPW